MRGGLCGFNCSKNCDNSLQNVFPFLSNRQLIFTFNNMILTSNLAETDVCTYNLFNLWPNVVQSETN